MADRTPNTNQLREWSDTSMGYALGQELEPAAYSTVHAIDGLRLAVLAASMDLVDALADRRDVHAGTPVTGQGGPRLFAGVDADSGEDLTMATASGYHCTECDFHVLLGDPDYDSRVDDHELQHDGADLAHEQADKTEIETFLQHIEDRLFYASSQSVDPDDVDRLVRMCRAALDAGDATLMRARWTPAETGGAR